MFRFGAAIVHLERHSGTFTIEALAGILDPAWIHEALADTGRASRRIRALPADLMVWLLIGMGLFRGSSVRNVLWRMGQGLRRPLRWPRNQAPASNAITKARDRLGLDPLVALFVRLCGHLRGRYVEPVRWRGLDLLALDGTTLKVPDSDANRRYFGAPGSSRGVSGYPQMRVVALMSAVTHIVLDVALAAYAVAEPTLAAQLVERLRPGSLLLLDRGFVNYRLLLAILGKESHFVLRAKVRMNLRRRTSLGSRDYLADAVLPRSLRAQHRALPEHLRVRVVSYQVAGFRPVRLLTTLLDPVAFPAVEIVRCYRQRWEVELGYGEWKTDLLDEPVPLRSQSPPRVLQEAYGLLIAFNLIRALMAEAGQLEGKDPRTLSFVDTLERLRLATTRMSMARGLLLPALYRELLASIAACVLPPRRPLRYARCVKVKMSNYKLNRRRHVA